MEKKVVGREGVKRKKGRKEKGASMRKEGGREGEREKRELTRRNTAYKQRLKFEPSLVFPDPTNKNKCYSFFYNFSSRTFLVAQTVKGLPAMRETQVRSLGWEDPLEKEMATHSSILAWRIPQMEEPGRLQSTELQRVGHD